MKSMENTQKNRFEEMSCHNCPGIERCQTFGYIIKRIEYEGREYEVWEKCPKKEKRDLEIRYQKALRSSGLPPEYINKTLANFEPEQNSEALSRIKKYITEERWRQGMGLILVGPVGVGKTHLASGIIHELSKRDIFVLFLFVPDFLEELRDTYDEDYEEEEDKFELAREAQVLVLDDLGTERITDWAKEKITQLLNYRYNNILPTIVTTNLTLKEMEERIGERALSRLLGRSEIIPIVGKDRRVKNASKGKN